MRERLAIRLLRGLLRLLPRDGREYAEEIEMLAAARRADLNPRRRGQVTGFWLRELGAAAVAVGAAWMDRAPGASSGGATRERGGMMEGWVQDLRIAFRGIRGSPAISGAVTASLAVGIGATLAIFAIVDGVLLNPISVPQPERVVRVFQAVSETSVHHGTAYPTLLDYRAASSGLEGPAGFTTLDVSFRAGERTDHLSAAIVTGDFFDVLRVSAARGRVLQPADDRAEAPAVVVIGHGLWDRAFGRAPDAVGRAVRIGGTPFEVVGVAPAGFQGVDLGAAPELWIPMARIREAATEGLFAAPNILETRAFPWVSMVGRLPDDLDAVAVEARLDATARSLYDLIGEESGVLDADRVIRLRSLSASAAIDEREDLVRFVGLLGGVVLLTLIVACANAANLISARTTARSRELGVRQALGAGRGRVVRHLLTESLALAALGGGAALVLATLSLRALRAFSLPGGIPLDRIDLSLDGRLVLFALALSVATAIAFGLGPAVGESRRDIGARVRAGGPGFARRTRGASTLLALQVGISVVLTVGALLFGRTLANALATDLGWEPGGLAAASVAFRGHGYPAAEIPDIAERLVAEVVASPDVRSAALAAHVPLAPSAFRLQPVPEGADDGAGVVHVNVVTPGYFATLGVPLVEGRSFGRADTDDAPEVAVLNRAAARLLWPDDDPLGRTLVLIRGLEPITVVGVVEDHHVHGVADDAVPYLYLPAAQNGQMLAGSAHLVARATAGDAAAALTVVRDRLRALDASLPVQDARLVEAQISRVLMPQRFGGLLLALLAGVSLAVSAIGVYGMITFAVRRRTREIGIRMALGAGPRRIVLTTAAGAAGAVAIGLGLGLVVAGGLSRFVEEYLYGITPLDLPSFAGGAAVLGAAALLAALLPAHRAVAVDPRTAMGDEG